MVARGGEPNGVGRNGSAGYEACLNLPRRRRGGWQSSRGDDELLGGRGWARNDERWMANFGDGKDDLRCVNDGGSGTRSSGGARVRSRRER